jgi:protein SCO1
MMRLLAVLFVAVLLGANSPAAAALSETDLAHIEAAPQAGAALPLSLPLQDLQGETRSLQAWLGNAPSVWVLADFTCQTLCGPIVSIVSEALRSTGLRPGADFRLIVVGMDAKDTVADAAAMKSAQVGNGDGLARHAFFLRTTSVAVAELTRAFGFRSAYDREHDQFAHPAAAFVVTPSGHIARVLAGLALDPTDLRLALVDAGQGRVGSFVDHVRLLCYGFDPARGIYTAAIGRMLASASAVTILVFAVFILILFRREAASGQE